MHYEKNTAPSGLACFNNVGYLANEDRDLPARVATQFGNPLEDVGCRGGREEQGTYPVGSMECAVYPCAAEKGVTFCCDCPDLPCDSLYPVADRADRLPHHTKVFHRCLIKNMGVDAWATTRLRSVKEVRFTDT